ncbi:hypothetical protein GCM10010915_03770 [Microbacterium faecale]|uniref:Uncharacterized protein n=1 Tax=Microbacterium faecale TaxID=1804630 RepID=A0A916Y1G1_9MICO|nr:hypothetical protein [Microbacterium faecale]GGD26948.1 hypothetical protein GCM10010915_03770 [Microbacterium faecale]
MTASQEHTLATDVEVAVRAVPGVSTLFRAGTLASNAIDVGARVIGIRDKSAPLIRVEQDSDGLRADIVIGVEEDAGAVETIRRVQAAARAVLAEQHPAPADIRITVVHINETATM